MPRNRRDYEFIAQHPHPGDDPVTCLAHVLDLFAESPDDEFVVIATSSIYGDGEKTGLTWADLRALAARLT